MAELESKFIAEMLSSRQLLVLLFVCESQRKKILSRLDFLGTSRPPVWTEFLDRFSARLAKLPEPERVYLIGSHLQSAEEIDIYCNDTMQQLIDANQELFGLLAKELEADPRFT